MALTLSACNNDALPAANLTPSTSTDLSLSSTAFKNGEEIPRDFTCDGANRSPALNWSGPPPGTKSFALILDDPDAPNGTFTHWIVYGIPAVTHSLSEDVPPTPRLPDGSKQGTNSFGKTGYGGPCPPNGVHHYHFKLYALGTEISLTEGASLSQVLAAVSGNVLAAGELVGTYSR